VVAENKRLKESIEDYGKFFTSIDESLKLEVAEMKQRV
jgi:hypothetical protein